MSVPKTDALPLGDAPTVRRCLAKGPGACKGQGAKISHLVAACRARLWRLGRGMIWDAIILGAGAAGMMAAIEAGRRGRKVLVIDHAGRPGREDPHLGRRAVQFHQPEHRAGSVPVAESPLCAFGAETVQPVGFHRPHGCCRDRLAREDPGPALLRRLGDAGGRDAAPRHGAGRSHALAGLRAGGRASGGRGVRGRDSAGGAAGAGGGGGDGGQVDPEDGGDGVTAIGWPRLSGCRWSKPGPRWCR
jgi:hypothetical protein